jgi:hypothetical protein
MPDDRPDKYQPGDFVPWCGEQNWKEAMSYTREQRCEGCDRALYPHNGRHLCDECAEAKGVDPRSPCWDNFASMRKEVANDQR